MKRRPWPLIVLALLHIFAPIGNVMMNAYLSRVPVGDYFTAYFLPENRWVPLVYMGLPILGGVFIYLCKKWSFIAYVVAMATLLAFNLYALKTRHDLSSMAPVILVFLMNALIVAYFMIPAVRSIYLDPRLRWWEAAPRYRGGFPTVFVIQDQRIDGEIANISEGGAFLKAKELPSDKSTIQIQFRYNDVDYEFTGSVIHHGTQNAVGVGLKFEHTPMSLQMVKQLTKVMQKDGRMLTDRLPGPEDSFGFWLKSLFKTGSGIVPSKKTR